MGQYFFVSLQSIQLTAKTASLKLENFRYTIRDYLLRFGITIGNPAIAEYTAQPRLPLILRLITTQKRGCDTWTRILKSAHSNSGVTAQELKWEGILNKRMGIHFWNACYGMLKGFKYNNKHKG